MEVRLQPEKKAQLAEIAAQRGLKTDELAQPVLSDYLEDNRFIEAVNVGLAAAERGEFVEHEEGGRKLKQILRPNARVLDYPRR
jgi:predicted transcriptional regulator